MKYFFWFFLIFLVVVRFATTRPVYRNGDKVRISSVVTNEPINYGTYQSLSLAGLKIYLPAFPEIHYGEKVVVEGVVARDKYNRLILDNPLLLYPSGRPFHPSGGSLLTPVDILVNLRQKLISVYQKSLPEPHASLLAGVVLGAKSSLPADFWQALKATGTMHVVVASGMNVTFVAGFMLGFWLLFCKRKTAIILALVGIWLYVVISGMQAPIIRAAIMGSLTFLAYEKGKVASAWRVLALTGLGMLILFPDWLGDLGFWLSFVATASLMLFQKRIFKSLKLLGLPRLLNESFSTSLAAQIGVAPILFVTFGTFNILSPLINAAVLWTIAPMMAIGSVGGVAGLVWEPLGKLVLYLVYPLTYWFVKVVMLFG